MLNNKNYSVTLQYTEQYGIGHITNFQLSSKFLLITRRKEKREETVRSTGVHERFDYSDLRRTAMIRFRRGNASGNSEAGRRREPNEEKEEIAYLPLPPKLSRTTRDGCRSNRCSCTRARREYDLSNPDAKEISLQVCFCR